MPPITGIHPEILRSRHRLSPQQINTLFGRKIIEESFEEKAIALGQVAEFLRVTDALMEAGISFIPLKGPLLSEKLFGDTTVRYSHDLDILVSRTDIDRSLRILESMGYQLTAPGLPDDERERRKRIRYSHHLSFNHNENRQVLELHWRLMTRQWLRFQEIEGLLKENVIKIEFAGRRFSVLGNEIELLYLIIHGGSHRWGRLKWIEDIHQFLQTKSFNRERFLALTRRLKAGRLVALCNIILEEYMPASVMLPCNSEAQAYMVKLARKTIEGDDYRGPESVGQILRNLHYSMAAYPGLYYKMRLLGAISSNSIFAGRLSKIGE